MAVRPADVQITPDISGAWLTDGQLLEGLRGGSAAAFSQLYRAQAVAIYNLCLRLLGSREDAQDVAQEVFVKACRQLPGCDADFRVRPWLYRVAVNACYDELRARKTHGRVEPLPDEPGASPIDGFEQAELSQVLEDTLAGLSVRHRTVMLLKDVHGLSNPEIAAILGVSRGATETLLFRAHAAFRRGYAALVRSEPRQACDVARRVVVDSVGSGLSDRERRRVIAHAKDCPDCRETVATGSLGMFCVGAFLRFAPLPAKLATPPFAAAIGGAGGSAGMAGSGLGAFGGAGLSTVGGTAASAAATASVASGGVSATVAAITAGVVAKASIVAIVASALVVAGGMTAHRLVSASAPAASKAPAAVIADARNGAQNQGSPSLAHSLGRGRGSTVGSRGHGGGKQHAASTIGKPGAAAAGNGSAAKSKGNGSAAKSKGNGSAAKSKGNGSAANSKGNGSAANSKGNGSAANSKGNGSAAKSKGNGSAANSKTH